MAIDRETQVVARERAQLLNQDKFFLQTLRRLRFGDERIDFFLAGDNLVLPLDRLAIKTKSLAAREY